MSTIGASMTDVRTPRLDARLHARLCAVAARLRRFVLVEGLCGVVGFLVLAGVFQFVVDYASRGMRWSMRAALLAVILLVAARLVWLYVWRPLRVHIGPADIAHLVERRFPHLASSLISAVRFAAGEVGAAAVNSRTLMAAVVAGAGQRAGEVDFDVVIDARRARRSTAVAGGLLLAVLTGGLLAPDMARLWWQRSVLLQDVPWPRRTRLVVENRDGTLFGARGDDVVIHATAEGVQPREVEMQYRTVSGAQGREAMVTVGNPGSYRYRYTFKNAQEDLTFSLRGGDDRTEEFTLRLLERPRVVETALEVTPPGYTRLEKLTLGDGQRAVQVLKGATVAIRVRTNKPVVTAVLRAGDNDAALALEDGERLVARVSPAETTTYHFHLVDEVGLENRHPVRFSIRVLRDDPPIARLKLRGAGEMVTTEALLPIEVEFADTHGLAEVALAYERLPQGGAMQPVALNGFAPHATHFATSVNWAVAESGAVAGERLIFRARAADFDDVSGPNEAQSPEVALRVVTRDEMLAELARREQEARMDFERMVDAQEQVRGGLLSALDRYERSGDTAALAAEVGALERRQRSLAASVNIIRQGFERILEEMKVNQLDTSDERERLGNGIIAPLGQLARRDMVVAADTQRLWGRDGAPEVAARVDPQQAEIVTKMRAVLATMIQWEGYQEVVNLLRDIVRLQGELNAETKKAFESEGGDVFDD